MSRPMESSAKRPRISIDVQPELLRRLRLVAAKHELTIQQYVVKAIEHRLREDLHDRAEGMLALKTKGDPVLAEVWDNRRDAEYDHLYSVMVRADQVT